MARKIVERVPEGQLQEDLERYRRLALELGATDARVITTDMVVVDERVRVKCTYPKCEWYGTSINCPPYAMEPEQTRKLVEKFGYAIFFRLKVPTDTLVAPTGEQLEVHKRNRKKRLDIVDKLESTAFYDGYYLAVGFGGGSCKSMLCPQDDCRALVQGKACRHPLLARSAMEGVGMDVYLMATKVGWDIYPLGHSPSDAPHGSLTGIVFIY